MNLPDPWVVVSKIGKPVGLKGAVRLWPEADLERILDEEVPLWLWNPPSAPSLRVTPLELMGIEGSYAIILEGYECREKAEELKNLWLVTRREDLPKLDDGYAYITDMVGAEVYTREPRYIGKAVDVWEYPANAVLVVHTDSEMEILVPLSSEVDLDLEQTDQDSVNRIYLNLPAGIEESAEPIIREVKPKHRSLRQRRNK